MRSFLSTACLFLLAGSVLGVGELEFDFGDIIRFNDHYGLALGERNNIGELFFHKTENGCKTDAIKPNTSLYRIRENFQDDTLRPQNLNDVMDRFNVCKSYDNNQAHTPCCGLFDFVDNNCEHTVTYIRYGTQGRVSCLAWYKADPAKNNILYTHFKNGTARPPRTPQPPPQCRNWQAPVN